MGKALGGIGKAVGKVAGIAAPFLPGPAGMIAGAASNFMAGNEANNQSNAAYGQMNQMAQQQAGAFNQYYMPVMQAYAQSTGFDPATGKFDPNYNPYSGAQGSARYNQIAEGTDQAADQAVSQLGADYADRGFTGNNTGLAAVMGDVRRAEAADLGAARRNLMVQGEDERFRRLAGMIPTMQGAAQQSTGTLNGLGANYASKAGNIGQNLGQLGGTLADSGVLGGWMKKKRTQSTSPGTSTANAG